MRDLILGMSMSLDGFVASANDQNDWIFSTGSPDAKAWKLEGVSSAGVHIMGSRTFADMAAYWPYSSGVFAPPMNEIPKVVFSRTGEITTGTRAIEDARANARSSKVEPSPSVLASWQHARVASDPLADEIARLKREDGKPIVAHGGAAFAQSLVKLGVVDEYRLLVHPVALGRGLPLFSTLDAPRALELVDLQRFDGGAVAHVFRPR